MTRSIGLLLLTFGVAGCITEERARAWVPPEIDETLTLASIGEAAHSLMCDAFSGYVHDVYGSQLLVKAACTAQALQTTANSTECARLSSSASTRCRRPSRASCNGFWTRRAARPLVCPRPGVTRQSPSSSIVSTSSVTWLIKSS